MSSLLRKKTFFPAIRDRVKLQGIFLTFNFYFTLFFTYSIITGVISSPYGRPRISFKRPRNNRASISQANVGKVIEAIHQIVANNAKKEEEEEEEEDNGMVIEEVIAKSDEASVPEVKPQVMRFIDLAYSSDSDEGDICIDLISSSDSDDVDDRAICIDLISSSESDD